MADEYENMMEEGEEEVSASKVVFDMPKGDGEFDGLEVGEKMTARCTIRKEEGGQACLVEVNGMEVSGYSKESEEEEQEQEQEGEGAAFDEMLEQEM